MKKIPWYDLIGWLVLLISKCFRLRKFGQKRANNGVLIALGWLMLMSAWYWPRILVALGFIALLIVTWSKFFRYNAYCVNCDRPKVKKQMAEIFSLETGEGICLDCHAGRAKIQAALDNLDLSATRLRGDWEIAHGKEFPSEHLPDYPPEPDNKFDENKSG